MLEAKGEEFNFPSFGKMDLRKLIKDKRGLGIGDIYPIVLTIAVVAILIAIIMMIFGEWQGITNKLQGETINDTLDSMDEFGEYVDNYTACGFADFAITNIVGANSSNEMTAVETANYTWDTDGEIYYSGAGGGDNEVHNASDWYASYTFKYGGEDCEAIKNISEDYIDFMKWIGIILLVVAAAIVLGVVISSFAGTSKERV